MYVILIKKNKDHNKETVTTSFNKPKSLLLGVMRIVIILLFVHTVFNVETFFKFFHTIQTC
jgi:hypothetical protein